MAQQHIISTRFYNNRLVRAIWDNEANKWFYSATDIVRAINDEPDYVKAGNYWRWLKKKLASQGVQLVSGTHRFKLVGPDGKKREADVLDDNGVQTLAKYYPNNRANKFLDWLTYSENTIDGRARRRHTPSLKATSSTPSPSAPLQDFSRFTPTSSAAFTTSQGRYAKKPYRRVASCSASPSTSTTNLPSSRRCLIPPSTRLWRNMWR